MSGSQVASNSGSALALASTPVQILKLVKPAAGRTDNFYASFDGSVKIDFTAIANEQVTFFHDSKNQSLHVIFADGSQIIIEPFFDSMGVMSNFVFEMAPGEVLDSAQFVSQFPITRDQSVLPALTDGPTESGAEFNDPSIDSLPPNIKLALLPPEELPTLVFHETIPAPFPTAALPTVPPSAAIEVTDSEALANEAGLPGSAAMRIEQRDFQRFDHGIRRHRSVHLYTEQPGDRQPRHAAAERGRDLHLYADIAVRHDAGQRDNGDADGAEQGQLQLHGDRRPRQQHHGHDRGRHHR
jgi:hypothetical protein